MNLCSYSTDKFSPRYDQLFQPDVVYPSGFTAISYFNDIVKSIPMVHVLPENVELQDLILLIDQANNFIQEKKSSSDSQRLKDTFQKLYHLYPEIRVIKYSYTVLLILNERPQLSFLFNHILAVPKQSLDKIFDIFLNPDSSLLEKAFALSTFVPSLYYPVPNLVQPIRSHYLLPDPLHILHYLSDFDETEIGYACHVMQLCHRYLLFLGTEGTGPKIEEFMPYFVIIGGSSFSRACFSRAMHIAAQIQTTNDIIINFLANVRQNGNPAFIEELFLYNTSESFSNFIPLISNIFFQYFIENLENLSPQMKMLTSVYQYSLVDCSKQLLNISNEFGNRPYLYWIYTFLRRLNESTNEVKVEITKNFYSEIQMHIQKLYKFLISAEKFSDPSIDDLIISTLNPVMVYLRYVILEGAIFSTDFLNVCYDIIFQSLHYIISSPVLEYPTGNGVNVLRTYEAIQKSLIKQPLIFQRCCVLSEEYGRYPVIALALSEIHIPINFLKKVAYMLILSDEPTCFYCLLTLLTKFKPSKSFVRFMVKFLIETIYVKSPRDLDLQQRILSRYFLLLYSVLNLKEFSSFFQKCKYSSVFFGTVTNIMADTLNHRGSVALQESIIFTLLPLYKISAFDLDKNYPIEIFLKNIGNYSPEAASTLLRVTVKYYKRHDLNLIKKKLKWKAIVNSKAYNVGWFMQKIEKYIKIPKGVQRIDISSCPLKKLLVFSLPWRQNRNFSYLLEENVYQVVFQKIENEKLV